MKITVTGTTATITPAFDAATLAKVKKWAPKLLTITEDKETVFAVDLAKASNSKGDINSNGAEFAPVIDGKLAVTLDLPSALTKEEAKDYVYNKVGAAAGWVKMVEKLIADNITAINESEAQFKEAIEIQ